MKKTQAVLIIAFGILLFGFIPSVLALDVTRRSLDDWLEPNYAAYPWGEENWVFTDFYSQDSMLAAKMGFPWPKAGIYPWVRDLIEENSLVVGDTIIEGSIKERELSSGEALITLKLDVKNAPLTVYYLYDMAFYCRGFIDEVMPVLGLGEDGYINYKVLFNFIIPEPGAILPNVQASFNNFISMDIHGIGYGIITERAVELGYAETAGVIGMVEFHQLALYKPQLEEDHPNYLIEMDSLWPVETVEIFELS